MTDDKEVKVTAKLTKIIEEVEKLTVLELADLVKALEEKFGVSASPAVVAAATAAPSGTAAGGADAGEEKSEYQDVLTSAGANKIGVIKAIREFTQLGLKEAKDMSEGAPVVIKENIKKEEAEAMKKKLEEAGAKVTLK